MLTPTLALLLFFGAPGVEPVATADLTAKIETVLETPEPPAVRELDLMIARFEARAQDVLDDAPLADELLRARVVLAWAQRDPDKAAAAMDEAIRSAAGRELPLTGLGTDLKTLAKQRTRELDGRGSGVIDVNCLVPCQVIVNERRSVNPTDQLPLGTYRVWVVARNGEFEPVQREVVLDVPGEIERLEFGQVEEPVAPAPVVETPTEEQPTRPARVASPAQQPKPGEDEQSETRSVADGKREQSKTRSVAGGKRLLPLWAEVVGLVGGVGLVATGVALLAIDGRCKNGGDPATCPTLIENTRQGAALIGVGAAAAISFGAVMGVDSARTRNHGASAMVFWTFRL